MSTVIQYIIGATLSINWGGRQLKSQLAGRIVLSPSQDFPLLFKNFFSPLVRKYDLFPHHSSFYNVFSVSVRRNLSTTTKISSVGQGNQRTKVSSPNTDFQAFKRYLEGHYKEPYGGQGKESRDHFIRLLTKTFLSVAEAQRLSHPDSSDPPKFINTAVFSLVYSRNSVSKFPRSTGRSTLCIINGLCCSLAITLSRWTIPVLIGIRQLACFKTQTIVLKCSLRTTSVGFLIKLSWRLASTKSSVISFIVWKTFCPVLWASRI